jgi:signal transduction histidine kinase
LVFAARAVGVAALGLGVAWRVLAARRTRVSLARLGADLGTAPRPGALRSALSRALGDRDLEVAYAVDGRHLDASGAEVKLEDDGRARTAIAREDEILAVVVHDPALPGEALQREIGSAARLAVDNERLQAELLARLAEVRASRARIVEAGDAERRRLERNLHDGAQQRLLAVSYELRVARAEALSTGNATLAALLERSAGDAAEANEELRRLAHGIFPAVLAEAGLVAALESFADTSPVPMEIESDVAERPPAAVESAAYAVAAAGAAEAARHGAVLVRVAVRRSQETLVLEVAGDATPAPSPAAQLHLADRAAALGGRLRAEPGLLRVELPCG